MYKLYVDKSSLVDVYACTVNFIRNARARAFEFIAIICINNCFWPHRNKLYNYYSQYKQRMSTPIISEQFNSIFFPCFLFHVRYLLRLRNLCIYLFIEYFSSYRLLLLFYVYDRFKLLPISTRTSAQTTQNPECLTSKLNK